MIIVSAVFVVGDDEQSVVPFWTGAKRCVAVVNELLAQRDIVVGMLTVATCAETGLKEGIWGKSAGGGSRLKVAEMTEVTFVRVERIGEVVAS